MSKRNGFVVTSAVLSRFLSRFLPLAALSGVLLVAGCKKKSEGSSGMPGVTATEIKIGQTMPYSGPASAYGAIGKADTAYFKMINEKGGINGRKITLISLDDGYTAPKAKEQTRKLVEDEGVAIVFGSVGTAPNTAVQPYLNEKKVPQLFVATGADKWADPSKNPWTMGWQPSYRTEAKIYARYLLKEKPDAKLCVLFQNDDLGKDYLAGLHDGFGDQHDKIVVKTASYEVTDPTVDSQIVTLQAAGCDTLLTAATPKAAAGTIRKVFDIGWKPFHLLSNIAVSITSVLKPAGLDKSTGVITGVYLKDPGDPTMENDPGMVEYRAFVTKYVPELDPKDANPLFAYAHSMTLVKVLTECGNDLSRENIMRQAANLTKFVVPVGIPGTEITTSKTDFRPFSQLQLARFNGTHFERFGDVLSAD
jgi:branched-chain amino acid transport system substrate-binding protein